MPALVERVSAFLKDLPVRPDEGIVVAVSGGPDSTALLHALAECQRQGHVGPLTVAHLNHRLRGTDSDADEAFVRDRCARLAAGGMRVEFRATAVNVAEEARSRGEGVEATARALRYEWFAGVARDCGVRRVATGHTADDQAETVLHRLLRGTGVRGLAGIPPRRPLGDGAEVIRPLLEVSRADVLAYLGHIGELSRTDASNTDRRFLRNRLRHELLPLLARDYNPAVVDVLCRLARQCADARDREETAARDLLGRAELPRAGRLLVFAADVLRGADRHTLREAFRLAWSREGWPLREMGFREWQRVADVAYGKAVAVDLPGRLRVRRRGKVIQAGPIEVRPPTGEPNAP